MAYCMNCGTQNPDMAKFCCNCGEKLLQKQIREDNENFLKTYGISIVSPDELEENGELLLALKRFDDAERIFDTYIKDYPSDYRGWWGKVRAETHDLDATFKIKEYYDGNEQTRIIENHYISDKEIADHIDKTMSLVFDENNRKMIYESSNQYLWEHRKQNCEVLIRSVLSDFGCSSREDFVDKSQSIKLKLGVKLFGHIMARVAGIAGIVISIFLLRDFDPFVLFILLPASIGLFVVETKQEKRARHNYRTQKNSFDFCEAKLNLIEYEYWNIMQANNI